MLIFAALSNCRLGVLAGAESSTVILAGAHSLIPARAELSAPPPLWPRPPQPGPASVRGRGELSALPHMALVEEAGQGANLPKGKLHPPPMPLRIGWSRHTVLASPAGRVPEALGTGITTHAAPRHGQERTETMSAMQRFRLPLSSLMVIGRSSLILSMASGQSSCRRRVSHSEPRGSSAQGNRDKNPKQATFP